LPGQARQLYRSLALAKDNERNLSFVIPGRPKGEPGIHLSKMRGGNSWIQIIPLRITFLD